MVEFEEVLPTDDKTLSDFNTFYHLIYAKRFYFKDEKESYSNLIKYLNNGQSSTEYRYHIILAKDETGVILGGAIFDYFKKSNSGMIEYIAVLDSNQRNGIGSELYNHAVQMIEKDADDMVKNKPYAIFCEVNKSSSSNQLYFWNKFGFKEVPFNYIQPQLSEDKKPVTELSLLMNPNKITPCGEYIVDVLMDYLKYSMGIEYPQLNKLFLEMYNELIQIEIMELLDIVNQGNS